MQIDWDNSLINTSYLRYMFQSEWIPWSNFGHVMSNDVKLVDADQESVWERWRERAEWNEIHRWFSHIGMHSKIFTNSCRNSIISQWIQCEVRLFFFAPCSIEITNKKKIYWHTRITCQFHIRSICLHDGTFIRSYSESSNWKKVQRRRHQMLNGK